MEASARITFGKKILSTKLSPLQAAEIAANKYGFYDLDIEPEDNRVRITASAHNRRVISKGETMSAAVERLLEMFTDE